jgi:hypothetical protein
MKFYFQVLKLMFWNKLRKPLLHTVWHIQSYLLQLNRETEVSTMNDAPAIPNSEVRKEANW